MFSLNIHILPKKAIIYLKARIAISHVLIKVSFLSFWQSCKHESWIGIAKYLMDDVPLLLKSDNVKDIHAVISVVFTSLPSNFEEFIKWVAEVRRREDGDQSLSPEEQARLVVKVFVTLDFHLYLFYTHRFNLCLLMNDMLTFGNIGHQSEYSLSMFCCAGGSIETGPRH